MAWSIMTERFSIECRKTKTKVVTLGHIRYSEPIKTRSKNTWLTQRAGNACKRVAFGFVFTSDWMKKWREFLNQSRRLVMQNHRESETDLFVVYNAANFLLEGIYLTSLTALFAICLLRKCRRPGCSQSVPREMARSSSRDPGRAAAP